MTDGVTMFIKAVIVAAWGGFFIGFISALKDYLKRKKHEKRNQWVLFLVFPLAGLLMAPTFVAVLTGMVYGLLWVWAN